MLFAMLPASSFAGNVLTASAEELTGEGASPSVSGDDNAADSSVTAPAATGGAVEAPDVETGDGVTSEGAAAVPETTDSAVKPPETTDGAVEPVKTTSGAVEGAETTGEAIELLETPEGMWSSKVIITNANPDLELEFSYGKTYVDDGFPEGEPLKAEVTSQSGKKEYTLFVPAEEGIIFYQATKEKNGGRIPAGSGALPVNEDGGSVILSLQTGNVQSLREIVENGVVTQEEVTTGAVTAELVDGNGWSYSGDTYIDPQGRDEDSYIYFTVPAYGNNLLYQITGKVSFNDYVVGGNESFAIFGSRTLIIYIYGNAELTMQVTKGAQVELGRKLRHYIPFGPLEMIASDTTSDADYDYYTYKYPEGYHECAYRVFKDGFMTEAKTLENIGITGKYAIRVDLQPFPTKRFEYSGGSAEDSMLMNVPDSAYLTLEKGQTFDIRPLRAWQIGNSETANFYIEPDYHYDVVDGDSVSVEGSNGYNVSKGVITAEKPGVSVVRVSYDPIRIGENNWNGVDPDHVGLIVVKVVEEGEALENNLKTNIDAREYDTVYIRGKITQPDGTETAAEETAKYSFTPDKGSSVWVLSAPSDPLSAASWGIEQSDRWTRYEADGSGAFTIDLAAGRNIVRVENGADVQYHVIRAKQLDISIANKSQPGRALAQGQTANVSFKGLSMPLPKLAAIYNPGFVSDGAEPSCRVEYQMNGERVYSRGTQYNIVSQNTISLILEEEGLYQFEDGEIWLSWFGSALDAHRNISDAGLLPNFAAPDNPKRGFSYLPAFSFSVKSNQFIDEENKLNYVKVQDILRPWNGDTGHLVDGLHPQNHMRTDYEFRGLKYNDTIYGLDSGGAQHTSGLPEDVDIYMRHFGEEPMFDASISGNEGQKTAARLEKLSEFPVKDVDITTEENGYPTGLNFRELIFVPKNAEKGYPKTYSFILSKANLTSISPYFSILQNITLNFFGKGNMSPTEGVLKPETVVDPQLGTVDRGYGYLWSETNYSVEVPYETEQVAIKPVDFTNANETHRLYIDLSVEGKVVETLFAKGRENQVEGTELGDGDFTAGYALISGPDQRLPESKPIDLKPGETTVVTMVVNNQDLAYRSEEDPSLIYQFFAPTTYTIKITRAAEPAEVTFEIPEGTSILVQKDGGAAVSPADAKENRYSLPQGSYSYTVSGGKYMATTFTLEVNSTEPQKIVVKPEDLTGVEEAKGRVRVSLTGTDNVFINGASVAIAEEPADLTAYVAPGSPAGTKPVQCVAYNYGGYTALHAVLEAMSTGPNRIDFTCRNGKLTPKVNMDIVGEGIKADWICTVNGAAVNPAETLVKDGDKVEFYYYSDRGEQETAWFTDSSRIVGAEEEITLTLMSAPIGNTDPQKAAGCSGAAIIAVGTGGSKTLGLTDANGTITVKGSELESGYYTLTAEKKDASDKNVLSYAGCSLEVAADGEKLPSKPAEADKIAVSFRLIGDTSHELEATHEGYVTWIATETLKLSEGASLYDAFAQSLSKHSLKYTSTENSEITSITAPKAYKGYVLAEGDNGSKSKWMFTVNGKHPNVGMKNYTLRQGDKIVWHYVDDYSVEAPWDLDGTPTYSWLEAKDVNPPSNSGGGGGGGSSAGTAPSPSAEPKINTTAKTDSEGKAAAAVTAKEITAALDKAAKESTPQVELNVSADSGVTAVETGVPVSSIKEIAAKDGALKVVTPTGGVTFDTAALTVIGSQSGGSDVKFTCEKVNAEKDAKLSDIAAIAGRPVYKLTVVSGGKTISDFGKGTVKLSLPYTIGKGEKEAGLKIAYIDEAGKLTVLSGSKYNSAAKAVEGTASHFSYYGIVHQAAEFTDVASGKWFYDAVMYLANNDIVKGISETQFGPDNSITRAEFVQILYNKNGTPAVSGSLPFADVKDGAWYASAVNWAYSNGIAKGTSAKAFSPDSKITRQDMAVMLTNYMSAVEKKALEKINDPVTFKDSTSIAAYAKTAVESMQTGGIISGVKASDGSYSFKPKDNATRAEAASMLAKLFQK